MLRNRHSPILPFSILNSKLVFVRGERNLDLEHVLIHLLGYRDRVLAGEACIAEAQLAADCNLAAGLLSDRKPSESTPMISRISSTVRLCAMQLVALRNIRAEEAGMTERRCRNSHVNLSRACVAQQLYQTAAGLYPRTMESSTMMTRLPSIAVRGHSA